MSLRSAHFVDAQLRRALRAYHRAEQRSVLCFAEVVARKLYRELGYATIFEYGAEALGFSRQRTYGFLRLAEAIERLPELRAALVAGEIGWTKAREIIKVACPKSIGQWLTQAKRLTRRELEERVRRARQRRVLARAANPSQRELTPTLSGQIQGAPVSEARMDSRQETLPELPDESPEPVTYRLTPIQFARYEALVERLHKSGAIPVGSSREEILLAGLEALVTAAGGEVSPRGNYTSPCKIVVSECPVCRRARVETNRGAKLIPPRELAALKCDAIIEDGKGRQRHAIPPRIRRAVLKRDGYRCQAPGCRNTRFLEVHHIKMRSAGGTNDAQNLITLCGSCHRMIHSLEVEETVRSRRRSPIMEMSANSRPPGVDPPAERGNLQELHNA